MIFYLSCAFFAIAGGTLPLTCLGGGDSSSESATKALLLSITFMLEVVDP